MRIKKETIQFLKELDVNNNRDWFNAHKDAYQSAHDNFTVFVQQLINDISLFDTRLKDLEAKNAVFRIYRDTRFSKDKTPYKKFFGASLLGRGSGVMKSGYYFHLKPEGSFLAGGLHMPDPASLNKARTSISENSIAFKKLIDNKVFKELFSIEGDQLVNVPRGFSKDDPMAAYLKHKDLLIIHALDVKTILSADFLSHCLKVCKAMQPFNDFVG